MFDPSSYRDSDYGLDRGETFEPENADDVPLADTSLPHVMTVLGPIEPDELGVCLTHEYLFQGRESGRGDDLSSALDHLNQTAQDLESFAFSGGRGVVDARTADLGRDAARLYQLAQRVPLHIIATTGRRSPLQPGDRVDADAVGAEFIRDLAVGMDGTRSLCGLIAVEVDGDGRAWEGQAAIRAAAMAHQVTGAAVAVDSATPLIARHALEELGKEGVSPDRVILQVLGHNVTVDQIITLAASGAVVSLGGIGLGGADGDARKARTIVRLFEAGHGDSVLISRHHRSSANREVGGDSARLDYLLAWFPLMLMEMGAQAGMVRRLLVENPRRALSILPTNG